MVHKVEPRGRRLPEFRTSEPETKPGADDGQNRLDAACTSAHHGFHMVGTARKYPQDGDDEQAGEHTNNGTHPDCYHHLQSIDCGFNRFFHLIGRYDTIVRSLSERA